MDGAREFLEDLRQHDLTSGRFVGVLNIMIGRRITRADGTVLSTGMTWRELAALLKRLRWDKDAVRELGLEPADLPPRDREKYWYVAISRGNVSSAEATDAGNQLAEAAAPLGYTIGPAPGTGKG